MLGYVGICWTFGCICMSVLLLLSVCLSVCLFDCLSAYASVRLSVSQWHVEVCPSIYLSVCLCVWDSPCVRLSACLSVCPSGVAPGYHGILRDILILLHIPRYLTISRNIPQNPIISRHILMCSDLPLWDSMGYCGILWDIADYCGI